MPVVVGLVGIGHVRGVVLTGPAPGRGVWVRMASGVTCAEADVAAVTSAAEARAVARLRGRVTGRLLIRGMFGPTGLSSRFRISLRRAARPRRPCRYFRAARETDRLLSDESKGAMKPVGIRHGRTTVIGR